MLFGQRRPCATRQSLYGQRHGMALTMAPFAPPHDETGHSWRHENERLFEYTKPGGKLALSERGISDFASGMPGFGELLSDDGIWTVLAYVRSIWPERVQEIQAVLNRPHQQQLATNAAMRR